MEIRSDRERRSSRRDCLSGPAGVAFGIYERCRQPRVGRRPDCFARRFNYEPWLDELWLLGMSFRLVSEREGVSGNRTSEQRSYPRRPLTGSFRRHSNERYAVQNREDCCGEPSHPLFLTGLENYLLWKSSLA